MLCFVFFLGKGHAQAALSLWNNMLEPVGAKQWFWHMGAELICPTEQHPYLFTKKNSAEALEEYKRKASASSTETTNPTTSSATTTTSETTVSTTSADSSTDKHKHRKHHKSDSDEYSTYHFAVFAAFFFLLMLLLIVGISRRQQIRVFIHGTGRRRLGGFVNPQYPDEAGEEEIWSRSNSKPGYSINSDLPKTHGTRINFE
jgi:hypothetical protein